MIQAKDATLSTALVRSISTALQVKRLPARNCVLTVIQDSYPQGFDCSNPEHWAPVVTNYHSYHEEVNPSEPWYMPEFQGSFIASLDRHLLINICLQVGRSILGADPDITLAKY